MQQGSGEAQLTGAARAHKLYDQAAASPRISPYLPRSPYISLHLPRSPYISLTPQLHAQAKGRDERIQRQRVEAADRTRP